MKLYCFKISPYCMSLAYRYFNRLTENDKVEKYQGQRTDSTKKPSLIKHVLVNCHNFCIELHETPGIAPLFLLVDYLHSTFIPVYPDKIACI